MKIEHSLFLHYTLSAQRIAKKNAMILHETGAGGCSIYFNLRMSVIATKSTGISSKTKRKVLNLHGVFCYFYNSLKWSVRNVSIALQFSGHFTCNARKGNVHSWTNIFNIYMTYMNLEQKHKNKYQPKALLLVQINMDKLLI